eukprot:5690212-Prymnesium_polylepis.1
MFWPPHRHRRRERCALLRCAAPTRRAPHPLRPHHDIAVFTQSPHVLAIAHDHPAAPMRVCVEFRLARARQPPQGLQERGVCVTPSPPSPSPSSPSPPSPPPPPPRKAADNACAHLAWSVGGPPRCTRASSH